MKLEYMAAFAALLLSGCVSVDTTPAENVATAAEEEASLDQSVGETQGDFMPDF